MKSTLMRIFGIMTLATSISAFGLSDKPAKAAKDKSNNTANCENTAAPASAKAEQAKGQSDDNEEKARQRLIKEQEKQWLHDLQYLGS